MCSAPLLSAAATPSAAAAIPKNFYVLSWRGEGLVGIHLREPHNRAGGWWYCWWRGEGWWRGWTITTPPPPQCSQLHCKVDQFFMFPFRCHTAITVAGWDTALTLLLILLPLQFHLPIHCIRYFIIYWTKMEPILLMSAWKIPSLRVVLWKFWQLLIRKLCNGLSISYNRTFSRPEHSRPTTAAAIKNTVRVRENRGGFFFSQRPSHSPPGWWMMMMVVVLAKRTLDDLARWRGGRWFRATPTQRHTASSLDRHLLFIYLFIPGLFLVLPKECWWRSEAERRGVRGKN